MSGLRYNSSDEPRKKPMQTASRRMKEKRIKKRKTFRWLMRRACGACGSLLLLASSSLILLSFCFLFCPFFSTILRLRFRLVLVRLDRRRVVFPSTSLSASRLDLCDDTITHYKVSIE